MSDFKTFRFHPEDFGSPAAMLSLVASLAATAGRPVDWDRVTYAEALDAARRLQSALWPMAFTACLTCGIGAVRGSDGEWTHVWAPTETHDPVVAGQTADHWVSEVADASGVYRLHCSGCGWQEKALGSSDAKRLAATHMRDAR